LIQNFLFAKTSLKNNKTSIEFTKSFYKKQTSKAVQVGTYNFRLKKNNKHYKPNSCNSSD